MTLSFVADAMLKRLARYLRVAGYSVLYAPHTLSDQQVMRLAEKSGRVLLTADRQLYGTAKDYLRAVLVDSRSLEKQLSQVKRALGVSLRLESLPARCPLDDSELLKIPKAKVKGKVPKGVFERQKDFWVCAKNKKHVYWKGAHWKELAKKLR